MSAFIKFFRRQAKPKAVDTSPTPSVSSVATGSPVSSNSLRIGTPGTPPPAPPPPNFAQLLSALSALPFLPEVPHFAEMVTEYVVGGVDRTFIFEHKEPNPRGKAIESLDGDYFRTNVPVENRSRFLRVQRLVVTRWVLPMDGSTPSSAASSPPRPVPSFPRLSALSSNLQRLSISEREGDKHDEEDALPSAAESHPLLMHDLERNVSGGPPSLLRAQTAGSPLTPGSPQLNVEATVKVYDRHMTQYRGWLDSLKPGDLITVSNKALGYRVRVFKVRVNIVCLYQYSPDVTFSPAPQYSDSPIPVSRHLLESSSPTGPRLHKSASAPLSMQQLADWVMQEEGAARAGGSPSPPPFRQDASPPPFNAPLPSMFRPVPSLLSSGSNISLSAASDISLRSTSNVYTPEPVVSS